MLVASPICFKLEMQLVVRPFSRAWAKTGKRMAARMAIIAITTSSSIRVKACARLRFMPFSFLWTAKPTLLRGASARRDAGPFSLYDFVHWRHRDSSAQGPKSRVIELSRSDLGVRAAGVTRRKVWTRTGPVSWAASQASAACDAQEDRPNSPAKATPSGPNFPSNPADSSLAGWPNSATLGRPNFPPRDSVLRGGEHEHEHEQEV